MEWGQVSAVSLISIMPNLRLSQLVFQIYGVTNVKQTFAKLGLWAYFAKFSFATLINGPSGWDNIDAWNSNILDWFI